MRRWMAAVLMLCLLLTIGMPAQASADRFSSMDDLASWLYYDCTYMLADEIEFGYMQGLDDELGGAFPMELLHSSGMGHVNLNVDRQHRRVTISDIEYYPGFKAAQAWEIEVTHLLDEEERTILARAEAMVEEAQRYAQSPYQVLVNLHDALMKRVTFTVGDPQKFEYRDTAVGALIYGEAECDGYADAFYLLCTLAGFQVRLLSGHSVDENGADTGGHMWNLVWLEDGWYHVDASWDDLDWSRNAGMTHYRYFLVGSSMMPDHGWDDDHLVSKPAPYTNWDWCYYTADNSGIAYGAYYNTLQDAANYAAYMQRSYDRNMIHIMIDGDYEGQYDRINKALRDSGLKGTWYPWAHHCGAYTFISIYIE